MFIISKNISAVSVVYIYSTVEKIKFNCGNSYESDERDEND